MDPTLAGILGGVSSIGGGILGQLFGGGQTAQANQDYQNAINAYANLQSPAALTKLLQYNQYNSAGQLNPMLAQNINTQNAMAGVQANPALVQAQTTALQQMQQRGQTGLGPQDLAALNQIRLQSAQQAQAATQAALQQQQMQGGGQASGSGAGLAAQLQAAQSGALSAAQQGQGQAALASQNALQALAQAGQMAGQMNTQQFGQAAQLAAAQNAMNQFNTQNQLGVQQQNIGAQNQSQLYNLQNAQQLANQNTAMSNQALQQQLAGYQQQYQNQLAQAGGEAGTYNQQANALLGQSQQTRQGAANIGAGLGGMFGSLGNYGQQQQNNQAFTQGMSNLGNSLYGNSNANNTYNGGPTYPTTTVSGGGQGGSSGYNTNSSTNPNYWG